MAWQYYDVRVALYQGDMHGNSASIGSALYYVKARNQGEAERKALKQAEEHRNPSIYGSTFSLGVVSVKEC